MEEVVARYNVEQAERITLSLRNFPRDLRRRLASFAAAHDTSMTAIIQKLVEQHLNSNRA